MNLTNNLVSSFIHFTLLLETLRSSILLSALDPHRMSYIACWLALHTHNKTSILGSPQQVHWTHPCKQKRTVDQPGRWAGGSCATMVGYTHGHGLWKCSNIELVIFKFVPSTGNWNLRVAAEPCFEALAGTAAVGVSPSVETTKSLECWKLCVHQYSTRNL